MLTGLDHVTLVVRDLDAARRDYERLLGRAPSFCGTDPASAANAARFALANAAILLLAPHPSAAGSEALRRRLDAVGEGLSGLTFRVASAAAFGEAQAARGVPTRALPEQVHGRRCVELATSVTRGLSIRAAEPFDPAEQPTAIASLQGAVEALDHVALRTSDPDAAIALYAGALGIRLALDRMFGTTRMLFFRVGGVTLELVQDPSTGEHDVFYGLAFRVRDIERENARLRAAGVTVKPVRNGNKPGTRVFSVKDGTCNVPTLFLRDPSRD